MQHQKKNSTHDRDKRGCQRYVGSFNTKEDAARARDIAFLAYFGVEGTPRQQLNFPCTDYRLDVLAVTGFDAVLQALRDRPSNLLRFLTRGENNAPEVFASHKRKRTTRISSAHKLYPETPATPATPAPTAPLACAEALDVAVSALDDGVTLPKTLDEWEMVLELLIE